jgi:dTDP-4-amino-4,6-dideoxygalactose transaminase
LYQRVVSLPLYPAMTEAQVRRVVASVKHIVATSRVRRPHAAVARAG